MATPSPCLAFAWPLPRNASVPTLQYPSHCLTVHQSLPSSAAMHTTWAISLSHLGFPLTLSCPWTSPILSPVGLSLLFLPPHPIPAVSCPNHHLHGLRGVPWQACTLINPRWDRGHYRLGLALEAKGSATEAQVSTTRLRIHAM